MAGKYFLIDTTRCTACRGCQVACLQWNKLPATVTTQLGTHQNPSELNGVTYRLVRFVEHSAPVNSMVWYFLSDSCRHCLKPPCKEAADMFAEGAILIDKNGAVIYTAKTRELTEHFQDIQDACPWSIPQLDKRSGRLTKCDMCHKRVESGLLPACVKACPTGALNFGDQAFVRELADRRLSAAKSRFGDRAQILNAEDVRALYLVVDDLDEYYPPSGGFQPPGDNLDPARDP